MSGESDNQLSFIFPDSVYNYLNTRSGDISQSDCDRLVENINKFDKCYDNSGKLKNHLFGLLNKRQLNSETVSNISCITEDMKTKVLSLKTNDDILNWCNKNFSDDYEWLNRHNEVFQKLKNMNLPNARMLLDYFVFLNDEGNEVPINEVVFNKQPILSISNVDAKTQKDIDEYQPELDGGAYQQNNFGTDGKLRLNLKKDNERVPILFTNITHTIYLTKRWRGEPATFSSSSSSSSSSLTPSNLADCSPDFNSKLDKRHIKPWMPRKQNSSTSTLNAMAHLRSVSAQPRITQVDLSSLGPFLARGFMGGSMEGGAQLDVDFSDCPSENKKGDKLSVKQSDQYATLFKSVVQRLNNHNEVSETVVNELKNDLEEYRKKECKLFQDAFRLANALKSQNNGMLTGNIDSLDAFKNSSEEVAKSETHLLECLTKILAETCKNS